MPLASLAGTGLTMRSCRTHAHFLRMVLPLGRDRHGVSAVEFALIAPILMALLGGIFTISMVMRAHNSLHTYAREAARGVAIGYMTVAEAKQFAETQAKDELRVAVSAAIDPATKGDQTDRDVIVTLSISQDELAKMTPFGNLVPGGLTSRVVMRSIAE